MMLRCITKLMIYFLYSALRFLLPPHFFRCSCALPLLHVSFFPLPLSFCMFCKILRISSLFCRYIAYLWRKNTPLSTNFRFKIKPLNISIDINYDNQKESIWQQTITSKYKKKLRISIRKIRSEKLDSKK